MEGKESERDDVFNTFVLASSFTLFTVTVLAAVVGAVYAPGFTGGLVLGTVSGLAGGMCVMCLVYAGRSSDVDERRPSGRSTFSEKTDRVDVRFDMPEGAAKDMANVARDMTAVAGDMAKVLGDMARGINKATEKSKTNE